MPNRHVIGRLLVEIPAEDRLAAQSRQHEIGAWARSPGLWQQLSAALDRLAPTDVVINIPRLELTIEVGSEAGFQQQLQQALVEAVTQFIRDHARQPNQEANSFANFDRNTIIGGIESVRTRLARIVRYFLETGNLPTYAHRDDVQAIAQFFAELDPAENEAFTAYIQHTLVSKPTVWQRLVYAIGPYRAGQLVIAATDLLPTDRKWVETMAQYTNNVADFWRVVWLNGPIATENPALFRQLVYEQTELPPNSTAIITEQQLVSADELLTGDEDQPDVFFIDNAGLVLLGQFLPQLFARCGWLTDNNFVDETARHQAIHLLHYIVTGQTDPFEFDLTLPKVLCNHPQYQPVPHQTDLTETHLTEADELLRAAIGHWSVLKNTSLAGLRETFLQRTGKLTVLDTGGWRLQVERKTVDILLDRLPPGWGYAMVRLPWMPKLLFVEW